MSNQYNNDNLLLSNLWRYEEITSISDWASKNVDFSLTPDYDTPIHNVFDSSFCPFWKEPVDNLLNPEVREIVIWKPSRAGCTETTALNAIRYHIYQDPIPMLFLGAQSESVERFFEERIVKGLDAVKAVKGIVKPRRIVGTRIYQNGATLTASYPANKSADKMFGYQLAIIDEASLCPSGTVDTLRKRLDTYRYGHLLILSSMDARNNCASNEDAIYIEWDSGDKREWFVNDGVQDFILKSGNEKTSWGLKWDFKARNKNGDWDLSRVYETAHYVTPSGKIWNNDDKNKAVKAGKWIPTNDKPTDKKKRSYRLDALNLPFLNGDLGHYAVEFLKAKKGGDEKLRIFIYENKCETWEEKQIVNSESNIKQNIGKYLVDNRPSLATEYANRYANKRKINLLTVDVHDEKKGFIYSVREWVDGGDSGLVSFGSVDTWQEIKSLQLRYDCNKILVDGSHKTEECKQTLITPPFFGQSIICFGRQQIKEMYQTKMIDPFEGSVFQGKYQLPSVTHNPDKIKSELYRLINKGSGKDWLLPFGVDLDEYIKQLKSEAIRNGKWEQIHTDNHFWDCEVLQLLGAIVLGFYTFQTAQTPQTDHATPELSIVPPLVAPTTAYQALPPVVTPTPLPVAPNAIAPTPPPKKRNLVTYD